MSRKNTQLQILQIQISMSKELELPTLTAHLPRGAFAKEAGSGSWHHRFTFEMRRHIFDKSNQPGSLSPRLRLGEPDNEQPDSQSFKEQVG